MEKYSCYKREVCRVCGSVNMEEVLQLSPTPIGDAYIPKDKLRQFQQLYPVEVCLCTDCSLSQLIYVVSPELLFVEHSIHEMSVSVGLTEHFTAYAAEVVDFIKPPADALAVDINCNDATMLGAFRNLKMRVLGTEPSTVVSQKGKENAIEILNEFFSVELAKKIKIEKGAATIVVCNKFANFDNLDGLMDSVKTLLSPDGVFVFEAVYVSDLLEKNLFELIYHEHLNYFSVKPLKQLFKKHGMELVRAQRLPFKSGTIRGFVKFKGTPPEPCVDEMIQQEEKDQIHSPVVYEKLREMIKHIKTQLLQLLWGLKAEGKTIAAYGASVTSTTLIYNLEFAGIVDYIVDDNPKRHGLYSPGHHIPVYAPAVIYEKKPDYVVILAWRYADTIMKHNTQFTQMGGRFILPLPEIVVTTTPIFAGGLNRTKTVE
ncbi:class I SAM-dependent methyltransferase [Candidatus Magnetomonas plexicatena]|uniref:class I SAM-dependent methyltransferase n=1 Tax=Candidatus Magnetomonas plexicatena TaxID=2552947 RepID=UPI001103D0B1|nr:class I SAM-dependent methyltransferase [Nitrospirales bacterium LBB_01]